MLVCNRNLGKASGGVARTSDPGVLLDSERLIVEVAGNQRKQWRRLARVSSTTRSPWFKPGHMRRPEPKGNNSKCWPLTSMSESKKRAGLNVWGCSHVCSSVPIAHKFMKTRVPEGMW